MMYMMYNEELFELPVKRLSRYRKGASYDKRSYPDYDHSVWFAFREHELVGAWTQSPSRAVACAFLSALEAGRVGVTDQFRPPPGPDHRLCSTRSIPPDIKIGYCIVALVAGMPFAPLLTRLAKGNVAMSTMLMVVLIVVTLIVVPLALSPIVSAVVPGVPYIPVWDVAWPLLVFILLPLFIGCVVRVRYPDAAVRGHGRSKSLRSQVCCCMGTFSSFRNGTSSSAPGGQAPTSQRSPCRSWASRLAVSSA